MEKPSTLLQTQNPKTLDPETTAAAAAATAAAESKKRKAEDGEFRNSKYSKIRAIVRDLRPLFIEVLQAPDFRNSKAARDIEKQMKIMIKLSKELTDEAVPHVEAPLTGGTREGHMGAHQEGETHASHARTGEALGRHRGGERHASHPQTGEIPSVEKETLPSRVRTMPDVNPARALEENSRGAKEYDVKQLEEGFNKTYVVGGSPIGWNFQFYPGGEAVYYGLTKASAVARRAAK